jgi:hypothetical protein
MAAESTSSAEAQLVDAIARRVVELLEGARARAGAAAGDPGADAEGGCLTVSQVAARYRVSRSWVYAHQRELGAMRLGQGPRARLRFDPKIVAEAITAFDGSERPPEPPVAAPRGRRGPRLIEFETLQ